MKNITVWDDAFEREFYSPEELAESDMRVDIISAMIEARKTLAVVPFMQ